MFTATEQVLARAKGIASAHLEASVDDIVVHEDGRVGVAGVPARALTWAELAGLAADGAGGLAGAVGAPAGDGAGNGAARDDLAAGEGAGWDGLGPLAAAVDFTQDGATFPFGAHVSVVEVDMATSPWMTAGGSSTRCSSPASNTAGSPRAWPRRCGSRSSSTPQATR